MGKFLLGISVGTVIGFLGHVRLEFYIAEKDPYGTVSAFNDNVKKYVDGYNAILIRVV